MKREQERAAFEKHRAALRAQRAAQARKRLAEAEAAVANSSWSPKPPARPPSLPRRRVAHEGSGRRPAVDKPEELPEAKETIAALRAKRQRRR